jgi:hypothetical protein
MFYDPLGCAAPTSDATRLSRLPRETTITAAAGPCRGKAFLDSALIAFRDIFNFA